MSGDFAEFDSNVKGDMLDGKLILETKDMQRLSVRYSGRVQGVGFRASVASLASSFDVTGRVCNVADGSVDLQAEGDEQALLDFHRAIVHRLERNIVSHQQHWSEVTTPSWPDFRIGSDKIS